MSLFQNAVIKKYLKGNDAEKMSGAYDLVTQHFCNATIQQHIHNSKKEQYQGEFLIVLFVNVLGCVKNPVPNFNLTTEEKNIKGSKKTDGACMTYFSEQKTKAQAIDQMVYGLHGLMEKEVNIVENGYFTNAKFQSRLL